MIQGLMAFLLNFSLIAFSASSSTSVSLFPLSSLLTCFSFLCAVLCIHLFALIPFISHFFSTQFLLFPLCRSSYSPPCSNSFSLFSLFSLLIFFSFLCAVLRIHLLALIPFISSLFSAHFLLFSLPRSSYSPPCSNSYLLFSSSSISCLFS